VGGLPYPRVDDVAEMTADAANRILVVLCVDRLRSRERERERERESMHPIVQPGSGVMVRPSRA